MQDRFGVYSCSKNHKQLKVNSLRSTFVSTTFYPNQYEIQDQNIYWAQIIDTSDNALQ